MTLHAAADVGAQRRVVGSIEQNGVDEPTDEVANSGIEFTELPPSMVPIFSVVRGEAGKATSLMAAIARLSTTIGFGVPASVHEWPPGPRTVTR